MVRPNTWYMHERVTMVPSPMADRQMSRTIRVLAVPAEFSSGPDGVQICRSTQWAVTRELGYPVRSYMHGMPECNGGDLG